MNSTLPYVTAILVTRNEENYIKNAMLSLINQTYPKERYELIVVDGISTDGTVDIVESLIKEYRTELFDIRLVKNEKHILASGWNIGIKEAKGDYVVRIDAHSEAKNNFIELNVKTMLETDAVCVGGKLITKSLEGGSDVVSMILSSSFGVGNSSFRVSDSPGYVDTAVYGLYKKSVFDEVGCFNEKYVRNQDIELHSRIKKAGGKFYFNPDICCTYYARNTVKKMLKQAYGNGKWNMVLLKNGSSALSIRHLVPFAFVLYILMSIVCGFLWRPIWYLAAGVLILHLLIGLAASIKKTKILSEIIQMPLLFMALHISYGYGYLAGIFTSI